MKKKNIIITLIIILVVAGLALGFSVVTNKQDFDSLKYDVVIQNCNQINQDILNGRSNSYKCELMNSKRNEKYTIYYYEIWEELKQTDEKDSVIINIEDLTDREVEDITSQYNVEKSTETVKKFLDSFTDSEYDIRLVYQTTDNVGYDILLKEEKSEVKETENSKTENGIYAIEYYYELVNSETMERYTVYCYDLSKEYNNAGAEDEVIIEIESLTEDELAKITNMVNKDLQLQKLNKLIKENLTGKYKTRISYMG